MRIKAECIAKSIDLRALPYQKISHSVALKEISPDSFVAIYKYGAVVFFGVSEDDQRSIRNDISPHAELLTEDSDMESAELTQHDKPDSIYNGCINIHHSSRDHLLIIADVLSKSVVLCRYEKMILEMLNTIVPIAENMRNGRILGGRKKLIKILGNSLAIQNAMVSRIMVDDTPELLWDRPDLEKLFSMMAIEYEIKERQRVLEGRLRVVTDTISYNTDILNYLSSYRVEWYITILIVVEVMLTLYEMFIK